METRLAVVNVNSCGSCGDALFAIVIEPRLMSTNSHETASVAAPVVPSAMVTPFKPFGVMVVFEPLVTVQSIGGGARSQPAGTVSAMVYVPAARPAKDCDPVCSAPDVVIVNVASTPVPLPVKGKAPSPPTAFL